MASSGHLEEIADLHLNHEPFETIALRGNVLTRYRVFSRHNGDLWLLILIFFLLMVAVAAMVLFAFGGTERDKAWQIIVGGAVIGAFLGQLAKYFESAQKRLAMVDLILSEVISIGRVFIANNIMGHFAALLAILLTAARDAAPPDDRSAPSDTDAGPMGLADAARKENYFTIFEKSMPELGGLSSRILFDVTSFYTFLKASRDATGAISLWDKPHYDAAQRIRDIQNVIYNCLLLAIHGKLAATQLSEQEAVSLQASRIFDQIALQSFLLLALTLPPTDPRWNLLAKRHALRDQVARLASLSDGLRDEIGAILRARSAAGSTPPRLSS